MAEPQAKRLKRCHDQIDEAPPPVSTPSSKVGRVSAGRRKSGVNARDTKATLLQHISYLEEEKTAAQARLEQENRLLKSVLNQPDKIPAVEEYLAKFMADRDATSYHQLWEDLEKLRAQNSCLLRECERLRHENYQLNFLATHVPHPSFTAQPQGPSLAHQCM
ncbi:hypothetical protein BD626DRAFT_102276 [Schizophyllum amplum]|uniref:Uncharacterized protein n=1 Tax=Schizophyllum amplum TaxID=97359 RepID=A0A550CRX9_9AGAR|nr:hypothetical protein BD626DRAFT_102276 [Auriculariopsis ampla]